MGDVNKHRGGQHDPDSVEGNGDKGAEFDAQHAESAQSSALKDPEAARVTPRESRRVKPD
jgi:hypothetical protein